MPVKTKFPLPFVLALTIPTRTLLICALSNALCAMTPGAISTTINLNSAGALLNGSGVADSTQYGQGNNNPTSNLAFLNAETALWNGAFNPDLPAAVGPVALNAENLTDSSYVANAGYSYEVSHFGSGQAGSSGGWWQAFYLGGAGDTFSLPIVGGRPVGEFSWARFITACPTTEARPFF